MLGNKYESTPLNGVLAAEKPNDPAYEAFIASGGAVNIGNV
jgi:hypothetical protein